MQHGHILLTFSPIEFCEKEECPRAGMKGLSVVKMLIVEIGGGVVAIVDDVREGLAGRMIADGVSEFEVVLGWQHVVVYYY